MALLYRSLCVRDLDYSAHFYGAVFGFRTEGPRQDLAGPPLERALELPGARITIQRIRSAQGVALRLVRFNEPRSIGTRERRPMNALGPTHLNFYVRDFDGTLADIRSHGGHVIESTRLDAPVAEGVDSSMIYCTDPDGVRIEIWTTRPYGRGNPMATALHGVDRKFSHSGLCVSDPARSLAFYAELGLQAAEIFDYREYPGALDPVLELKDARLFAQMMRSGNDVVELLQFDAPPPTGTGERMPAHQLGFSDLAFEVDDLDAAMRAVADRGGRVWMATRAVLRGHEQVQCSDPDGVRITLMLAGAV